MTFERIIVGHVYLWVVGAVIALPALALLGALVACVTSGRSKRTKGHGSKEAS